MKQRFYVIHRCYEHEDIQNIWSVFESEADATAALKRGWKAIDFPCSLDCHLAKEIKLPRRKKS